MRIRLDLLLIIGLCCAGCGALAGEISDEMAPQIGTGVAIQAGTEVAVQVGTAVAEQLASVPEGSAPPPGSSNEGASAVAELPYDCVTKACGKMAACEEAVYKLYVCGDNTRDANNDGVPCESLCRGTNVFAIATSFAGISPTAMPTLPPGNGEIGVVTRVVDGDTIDVLIDGENVRVRYLQMNTPERDEPCYREATQANADLVEGKVARLVPDVELVDPYDRLLRYIYVEDVLVNRVLVEQGYAEVALYPPNDKHYDEFLRLEAEAAAAGRGCHPTGIFADGSTTR